MCHAGVLHGEGHGHHGSDADGSFDRTFYRLSNNRSHLVGSVASEWSSAAKQDEGQQTGVEEQRPGMPEQANGATWPARRFPA